MKGENKHNTTSIFKKIIDGLVFSNLWIAFGAIALVIATEWTLGGDFAHTELWFFILCATLLSYNLHRLVALQEPHHQKDNEVIEWSKRNTLAIKILFGLSVLGCGISFFSLRAMTQKMLLFLGFITVFYSLPFLFSQSRFKLREIPGLKIFLIAFVWAFTTVLLPLSACGKTEGYLFAFDSLYFWTILLERFLFIFVITLPFDIRDAEFDQEAQLKTIPNTLGIPQTKILGYLTLLILLGLGYYNYGQYEPIFMLVLLLFYGIISLLIYFTHAKRNDHYYLFWIDGTMILWGILFTIFYI